MVAGAEAGGPRSPAMMPDVIEAVVFDVGETLVDESRE